MKSLPFTVNDPETRLEFLEGTCNFPEAMQGMLKPWLFDDRHFPRGIKNPMLPEVPGPLKYATMPEARSALRESLDDFIGRS